MLAPSLGAGTVLPGHQDPNRCSGPRAHVRSGCSLAILCGKGWRGRSLTIGTQENAISIRRTAEAHEDALGPRQVAPRIWAHVCGLELVGCVPSGHYRPNRSGVPLRAGCGSDMECLGDRARGLDVPQTGASRGGKCHEEKDGDRQRWTHSRHCGTARTHQKPAGPSETGPPHLSDPSDGGCGQQEQTWNNKLTTVRLGWLGVAALLLAMMLTACSSPTSSGPNGAQTKTATVPNVVGLPATTAALELAQSGLRLSGHTAGAGRVRWQSPRAGSLVPNGTGVSVQVDPRPLSSTTTVCSRQPATPVTSRGMVTVRQCGTTGGGSVQKN